MAFIDEKQGVFRHIFEKGRWRFARTASGQVTAVVFDAGAGARGLDHLQIEGGALIEPLRFQQFAFAMKLLKTHLEFGLDAVDRLVKRRTRRDIVAGGIDADLFQLLHLLAGQRIEFLNALDLVAEHIDAPRAVFIVRREDFDDIAAPAESAALEGLIIALVLQGHQIGAQLAFIDRLADRQVEGHGRIGFDRTDTIDTGDRGDNDHIIPFQNGAGGRVAHPVDLLIDRRVLLDEGIGARHIGFRLVVVVIGDEILDGIIRKEGLELAIELGGQGLVVRHDQGRTLGLLDDLGHGEGFTRSGHPQQNLIMLALGYAFQQVGDGARLIAGRLIGGSETEFPAAFRLFRTLGLMRHPRYRMHRIEIRHEGAGIVGKAAWSGRTCHEHNIRGDKKNERGV